MNFIRNEPETLHIGADYRRGYEIGADFDLTSCTAVMKVRSIQGKLLAEAECVIHDNIVYCTITAEATKNIGRNYRSGQYDFSGLIHGNETTKIVMGDMKFIHDVSAH